MLLGSELEAEHAVSQAGNQCKEDSRTTWRSEDINLRTCSRLSVVRYTLSPLYTHVAVRLRRRGGTCGIITSSLICGDPCPFSNVPSKARTDPVVFT